MHIYFLAENEKAAQLKYDFRITQSNLVLCRTIISYSTRQRCINWNKALQQLGKSCLLAILISGADRNGLALLALSYTLYKRTSISDSTLETC